MAEEKTARAIGKDLPISIKNSTEICNYIRGNKVELAKKKLQDAIDMKAAIPFKRFTKDIGHKRNIAAGRYSLKACMNIMSVLDSAVANARNIGLNTNNMTIKTIIANKAARPYRQGRKRRVKMKRTHIEIIVSEAKK